MRQGVARALIAAIAGALCLAGGAQAQQRVSADRATVRTITGLPKIVLTGAPEQTPLASGGDQNGDGTDDPLAGSPLTSPLGRKEAGSTYAITGGTKVDIGALTGLGYRLDGAPPALPVELDDGQVTGDRSGTAVAGLGDVNGDGLDDIAIGAPRSSAGGTPLAGAVWVVFGRRPASGTDLGSLGAQGFRIDGPAASSLAGSKVAPAGDTDGDGLADIAVSAIGSAWVVPGQRDATPVRLGAAGGPAREIVPPPPTEDDAGLPEDVTNIAGVGDVNGDGLADVGVGAPRFEPRRRYSAGSVFVVTGSPHSSGAVRLGRPLPGVVRIDGEDDSGLIGDVIAPAGDTNGDGLGDILLGAPDLGGDSSDETDDHGAAYVVRGGRALRTVDLARPGTYGLRIVGDQGDSDAQTGSGVAAVGDLDGDGRGDIAIGAPGTDGQCRRETGSVYLVDGRAATGTVALRARPRGTLRIDGAPGTRLGAGLAPLRGFQPRGAALLAGSAPGEKRGPAPALVLRTGGLTGLQRAIPSSGCLSTRPSTFSTRRMLRTGRTTVRVVARGAPRGSYVNSALALEPDDDAVIAEGIGRVRRERATVRLRVTKRGRRLLQRTARRRALLFSQLAGGGSSQTYRVTRVRLRP